MVFPVLVLGCTWRETLSTCVLESDFGFVLNCAFKNSGLFRVRNLGGVKGYVGLGESIAKTKRKSKNKIPKKNQASGFRLRLKPSDLEVKVFRSTNCWTIYIVIGDTRVLRSTSLILDLMFSQVSSLLLHITIPI